MGWDDEALTAPYWESVASLGVPIFVTPGHGPIAAATTGAFGNMYPREATAGTVSGGATKTALCRGFIDEMALMARLLERHPTIKVSITHGFP
eukprot:SAG11_NODE_15269_length_583_cov_1.264463_1_plen_92_part_01